MKPPILFSGFGPYSRIRRAERTKSPVAESGDARIRIGEHMPTWSVMDLGSLQAAEASRLGHLFSLGVGQSP
jgi:hypothetical protein